MSETLHITEEDKGQRLDVYCVSRVAGYSRGAIQRAIKNGDITVNGREVKPRHMLSEGDEVYIDMQEERIEESEKSLPKNIDILHEDKHMVVIHKPAGVVVHPGVGQQSGTLVDWFVHRYPDAAFEGEWQGIVHRLDKDTSGVMVLAKTQEAYEHLKKQFAQRRVKKEYIALVFGVPGERQGRITRPLVRSSRNPMRRMALEGHMTHRERLKGNLKEAITEWRKEEAYNGFALLRVYPLTGRTHQIRAHLHFLGFPIVGDQLYVFKRQKPPVGVVRHLLHAEKLVIETVSGKKKTFIASPPDDFISVIKHLKNTV